MRRSISVITMITLLLTMFTGCNETKEEQDSLSAFLSAIAEDDLQDMTLTVYYMDSIFIYAINTEVESLIKKCEETADNEDSPYHKRNIHSSAIQEHRSLLQQLDPRDLVAKKDSIYTDARICLQFEKKETGQIWRLTYSAFEDDGATMYALFNGTPMNIKGYHKMILEAFLPNEYLQ